MNFDILGKDIAVLFILAVIIGIATYFYVLHKKRRYFSVTPSHPFPPDPLARTGNWCYHDLNRVHSSCESNGTRI